MRKLLVGIIFALTMLLSVSATVQPWNGNGWAWCNVNGNYGGWDKTSSCWVAWDGITQPCIEDTRDATFQVGEAGKWTKSITIQHLDGIAETLDSFAVLDGDNFLCSFVDSVPGPGEVWKTLTCDNVWLYGVKTLTLHPLADIPWSGCRTWGQVAISDIEYTVENEIPEFGVIGAVVVLGLAGLFIYRKRK